MTNRPDIELEGAAKRQADAHDRLVACAGLLERSPLVEATDVYYDDARVQWQCEVTLAQGVRGVGPTLQSHIKEYHLSIIEIAHRAPGFKRVLLADP